MSNCFVKHHIVSYIYFCEKPRQKDTEKNEKNDVRVMREVRKLANTIESDIQLTVDVPSENEDGKLPVLDLKV